jgi:hypothetical protein
MANRPKDYTEPSKDVPAPIEEPPVSEHLEPEHEVTFPDQRLQGVFRYMGETYKTYDHYGIPFDRTVWVEIYDPFIAKKCRGSADFETKGKDNENAEKAQIRDQREIDRQTYIKQQELKKRRAERNADAILGRE